MDRGWTIKAAFEPNPFVASHYFAWHDLLPIGDPTRDGRADFLAHGWNYGGTGIPNNYELDYVLIASGGAGTPFAFRDRYSAPGQPTNLGTWWSPLTAMVMRPGGLALMAIWPDSSFLWRPFLWDLSSRRPLGSVPLPPPPAASVPQMNGFTGIWWAGDVNVDGYDDLFYQGMETGPQAYVYSGLIDGQSLSVVWQDYATSWESFSPVSYSSPDPPPDLDGDGIADFVSEWILDLVPGQLPFQALFRALSGVDGRLIWERRILTSEIYRHTIVGRDLNGDGIADLVSVAQAEETITAMDGATGATIWEVSNRILDNVLPPTTQRYYFVHPCFFTGVSGAPGATEIGLLAERWDGFPTAIRWGIAHVNARDGSLVTYEEYPHDLQPWNTDVMDAFLGAGLTFHFLIGDVDRDGFTEIARTVPTVRYGRHGYPALHMVILGQRTLFVADAARVGSPLTATVSVPTAGGLPFRLLTSQRFAGMQGVTVGGWRSALGSSAMLRASVSGPNLAGVLDAAGEGSVTVDLPSNPALIGSHVYSQAVIVSPGLAAEVFTLSTVGVTAITN